MHIAHISHCRAEAREKEKKGTRYNILNINTAYIQNSIVVDYLNNKIHAS